MSANLAVIKTTEFDDGTVGHTLAVDGVTIEERAKLEVNEFYSATLPFAYKRGTRLINVNIEETGQVREVAPQKEGGKPARFISVILTPSEDFRIDEPVHVPVSTAMPRPPSGDSGSLSRD